MGDTKIYYHPYRGLRYDRGFRGRKLLIVGESFYGDVNDTNGPTWLIGSHTCSKSTRFCTAIERVVLGSSPAEEQRWEFWVSVAFTNFVQESLSNSDAPPTDGQLRIARAAFVEALEETQPDLVFLFSSRFWCRLPDSAELPGSHAIAKSTPLNFALHGLEKEPAYIYQLSGGHRVLAGRFNHPHNLVHLSSEWHQWSNELYRVG